MLRHPLAISTALALCACGREGRKLPEVDDPALLASAFEKLRADRAPQVAPAPVNLDPMLLGFDKRAGDSPYFNNVTFNAVLCEAGGRAFCFTSRDHDGSRKHALHWIEVGSGKPYVPVVAGIEAPPSGLRLAFGARPVPGGLVVVYPDGTRVMEARARLSEEGLLFAPPRAIHDARLPILGLQLTPTDDRLHLLWTTLDQLADSSLYHSSAATAGLEWSEPRLLSSTVQYGNACMAAGDRDVYVAWCDFRHRKRHWDYYTNTAKVFLTATRDGGKTFATVVTLHASADESAVASAVDIAVGRGGLAVHWLLDARAPDPRYVVWARAAVDFDLQRMIRGSSQYGTGAIPGPYRGFY